MSFTERMAKILSVLWLTGAGLLSLAGVAAFIYLFMLDLNIFYLILSPVILAVYQFPAVLVFRLWQGWRRRHSPEVAADGQNSSGETHEPF
jgi:membrane protein implicated in regulation of membrane protease activity